jgi:hypothetical protein
MSDIKPARITVFPMLAKISLRRLHGTKSARVLPPRVIDRAYGTRYNHIEVLIVSAIAAIVGL